MVICLASLDSPNESKQIIKQTEKLSRRPMKGNLSSNLGVATYKNIYLGCGGLLLHPHSSPFLFLIFHTFRIFFIQHLDNLGKVFTFFAFFFTSPSINFAFFRQSVVLVLHPHSLPFSLSHFTLFSFFLFNIFSIFWVVLSYFSMDGIPHYFLFTSSSINFASFAFYFIISFFYFLVKVLS